MYRLIVDGSFCIDKNQGGVGGYILDEENKYKDHFTYSLESKVVHQHFEMLAIIAGLNLALKHEIKNLHIHSDEHGLVQNLKKCLKDPLETIKPQKNGGTELFNKILSLIAKFETIKVTIFKCSFAHELSRIYLGHKSLEMILSILKKSKPMSSKKVKFKLEKNVVPKLLSESNLNKKSAYFTEVPESRKIYIHQLLKNSNVGHNMLTNKITVKILFNEQTKEISVFKENTKILSVKNKKDDKNNIPMFNYCLSYLSKKYQAPHINIKLVNVPREYTKYLWSLKRIDKNYLENFEKLANDLVSNNCKELSYEHY